MLFNVKFYVLSGLVVQAQKLKDNKGLFTKSEQLFHFSWLYKSSSGPPCQLEFFQFLTPVVFYFSRFFFRISCKQLLHISSLVSGSDFEVPGQRTDRKRYPLR